jgi:uncharacterized protein (DUF3820 family)
MRRARGAVVAVTEEQTFADTNREELIAVVNQVMPLGRFKGRKLLDLPEPYVVWFKRNGLPNGKLGERLAVLYEIKVNGLEPMLRPLLIDD